MQTFFTKKRLKGNINCNNNKVINNAVGVDVTEQYFQEKFNLSRSDLKRLVNEAHQINEVIVEPFTAGEILSNLKSCNFGSAPGKDGILYADFMLQWNSVESKMCNVFNIILNNEKATQDW